MTEYVNTHTFYLGFVVLGIVGVNNLLRGRFVTAACLFWGAFQFVFPG